MKQDKLRLFFHRDFDGVCSAALFLCYAHASILTTDATVDLTPVDYEIKKSWSDLVLNEPSAIVDFLYHPQAQWWYDHHDTTFVRTDWQLSYKPDGCHLWNTSYKSCPRLIVDSIQDDTLRYRLEAQFSDYLYWCDIVDSAGYESAEQLMKCKEPALQINLSLLADRSADYLKFLVHSFAERSIEDVAASPAVRDRFQGAFSRQDRAVSYIRNVAQVENRVAFCDLTEGEGLFHRYAAFYIWPDLKFQVAAYKLGGQLKITIGSNPWAPFAGPDLGDIAEGYGGGGHARVAGITLNSRKRAVSVGQEVAKILRGEMPYSQQLSFRHEVIRQSHR